ncbi:MAG: bifunctional 5,10-methylenetetrahydrofolate dehydrogenase/5,10-methenyltetrahydrofolate cyclohydrolase [Candidatus Moranbacteria bacterium]|nr:bifunctional 5,10-methylenetetrahydrofolate dehydrogenase/5,10-methenyltetrahydrofolate cyclohydrolase [Candidatus Moranbacteria bacterium]
MKIIEGKKIAEEILGTIKKQTSSFSRMPGLAVILVGDDEASKTYVQMKKKISQECGILFFDYLLPETSSKEEIETVVNHLNLDEDIDGILVQLPLPSHLNKREILEKILPSKDVDGLTTANQKLLETGEGFLCPFPKAILFLLRSCEEKKYTKNALIITNSDEFGIYMKSLLEKENLLAEYSIFINKENLEKITRPYDIIISAVGIASLITADMVKDGAIVIDGGIEKKEGKVKGDIDQQGFEKKEGYLSPVPGGVGPVTVACLVENVVLAYKKKNSFMNKEFLI